MKRFLWLAAMAAASAPALAGVSVTVGQPGFYGRIDIGNLPEPRVIYAEPVVIQRAPMGEVREPIYLHVPQGHERNWRKHCRQYNACGQPVYFVHDDWYQKEYVPRYREDHGEARRDDQGEHRGDERDRGRSDDRDHGRSDDRSRDHGHGER
ncbi:MAG TPA: hypothetical protein VN989_01105 [Casimicrobiaceae bacterium]|nr:hypothetical protein [Casimicrobiaceae bacterium]